MNQIKFGKHASHLATGGIISRLPYGQTVLGNFANNIANNLINKFYNSHFGDDIVFVSASNHILKRYVAGLAARQLFSRYRNRSRISYLKSYKKFQEHIDERMQDLDEYRKIIEDGRAVATKGKYKNQHTGTDIDAYIELKIPDDVHQSIIDVNKHGQAKATELGAFIDPSAIISTSSKKNVVLTAVAGRDTSRKEYVSGGDLVIKVSGKLISRMPDVYPMQQRANFVALMEWAGVLEVDCLSLRAHNVTHLMITDYSIEERAGFMNMLEYSFSAVGIAPSEEVKVTFQVAETVRKNSITLNSWMLSKQKERGSVTNGAKKGKWGENKKVRDFIEKWL